MKFFLNFSEQEIESLYFALSFLLYEYRFEFEDDEYNQALEEAFDKIIIAYEDMQAPIDEEEQEFLERRFRKW